MGKRRVARATAWAVALLGTVAVTMLTAGSAQAATTPLTGMQTTPVASGAYTVQNNEWGTSAPESITTDGNADFTVAKSSIDTLGGYPSIYAGCHWDDCTQGGLAAHPVQVSTLTHPGTATTSWDTTQPGGSAIYDAAYDLWFNRTPGASGHPDGAELMIWLNLHGPIHPYGWPVGPAIIDGVAYQVWEGAQPWGDTITYVMDRPATSVRNLDVGALTADAVRRGYIRTSWYLVDVEAGFELWRGGAGLATDSFSVTLNSGRGSPTPTPTPKPTVSPRPTPTPKPTVSPRLTPTPSPTSTFAISVQAMSRGALVPGSATNATVDFKNAGSATVSNVTVVIEVLSSAGTVVGSQTRTGQNIAPQQTMSETYTWTASSSAREYIIEGLVRASSGKVLKQAQVGEITVSRPPPAHH